MTAMLGMYDMPALRPANDRFWQAIRAHLGEGPEKLCRTRDFWEIWTDPDLVLAQTCGMPYRMRLHGKVTLVGTPDYGLPGCPPGYYNSVLVVRADAFGEKLADFRNASFAYNDTMSQSGWAAPITHFGDHGVTPGQLIETGAHLASAQAVATGAADIAGLDALTWALICEHDTVARSLRVLDRTPPTPGLPLITNAARDPVPLRRAVTSAIAGLSADDRESLHLNGLVLIPPDTYLSIPTPPQT